MMGVKISKKTHIHSYASCDQRGCEFNVTDWMNPKLEVAAHVNTTGHTVHLETGYTETFEPTDETT